MARLTISLPDDLHSALKEAAARRRRPLGDLIAESLELYGIKGREKALELLARARETARLTERQALKLAVEETRASRAR